MAGVAAAALLSAPVRVLEVRHEGSGRLLWRVPVHAGTTVELRYTNSIYNAPTIERFAINGESLHLVEVSTTKEAVLEYMRIESPYEKRDGRFVARVSGPTLTDLATRIGQTGQQRLAVDGVELPLYRIGTGEAATISLVRMPRLLILAQRSQVP